MPHEVTPFCTMMTVGAQRAIVTIRRVSLFPIDHLAGVSGCEREADWIADALVEQAPRRIVRSTYGPGQLPRDLRKYFERALGRDLSDVTLHTGPRAQRIASALGARACALGRDVFFGAGEYRPGAAEGLRLLAHEIVHIIQQGASRRARRGAFDVRWRSPRIVQCKMSAAEVVKLICPPGSEAHSVPSTRRIGTAYGKWLGLMYMLERHPAPYGLVDFGVFWKSRGWFGGTVFDLHKYDPGVAAAFLSRPDFTRSGLQRTDILDAQRDEVYEIKPRRSAAEGPPQLAGYLTALTQMAGTTSPALGPVRPRAWKAGTWDPSRYPMVVPGKRGELCMLHAWNDPNTPGLIVYDIICCAIPGGRPAEQPAHATATKLKGVVNELKRLRPELEAVLEDFIPVAPTGSTYVFLVPPRVFETFVIGPWEKEQNRKFEQMYGTRLGPVHQKFLLELFVLSSVLPTAALTDAAFVMSGFMGADQVAKMWGFKLLAGLAATPVVLGLCLLAPEAAVGAGVVQVASVAEGTVAVTAGAAVATEVAVASSIPAAASPFLAGNIIVTEALAAQATAVMGGEAILAGAAGASPWIIGGAGVSEGVATALGLTAVIAVAGVSGTAEAGTPAPAEIVGADGLYLAPIELVVPKRGEIVLGAEVKYSGERYFIIGIAKAEEP